MNHKFLILFLESTITLFHCVPRVLGTPIVGGLVDYTHRFKYHVSIHMIDSTTEVYKYQCGGTIIHSRFILTAANCFTIKQSGGVTRPVNLQNRPKILAGTNKIDGSEIKRDVLRVSIPPGYETNAYGDIAVVKLTESLYAEVDSGILEIMPLGKLASQDSNKEATVCGFGRFNSESEASSSRQPVSGFSELNRFLTVTLLEEHKCKYFEICAVNSVLSEIGTACDGDNGGGLIFRKKGVSQIVGVYSHGSPNCDTNEIPMVFTRVSLFKDDILQIINEAHDSRMQVHRFHPDDSAGPSRRQNEEGSHKKGRKDLMPKLYGNKSGKNRS